MSYQPTVRRPLDWTAVAVVIALDFIWGLQQVAIKAAGDEISPMLQVALRSGIAAVIVLIYKWLSKDDWNPQVKLRDLAYLGLGFAGEFFFVAWGLNYTSAAHMSVLLYLAPLISAVGLSIRVPEERLVALQWVGLLVAFLGIVVAFGLPALMASESDASESYRWIFGDFLGLCAAFSWGMTTVCLRASTTNQASTTQLLFWQLLGAFVLLTPIALWMGETTFAPTWVGWLSFAYQTLIVSVVSYLVWCAMLRRYFVARLGVLIFVTPLFGVLLSVLILDEVVGWPFILGTLCVFVGLLLVQGTQKKNG